MNTIWGVATKKKIPKFQNVMYVIECYTQKMFLVML